MYLPNTTDYYQKNGSIKRLHPKKRKLSRGELNMIAFEKEHPQKLNKSEKRAFRRVLKRMKNKND